jgi:MerR family transcriptional regulator, copper efflux regulator
MVHSPVEWRIKGRYKPFIMKNQKMPPQAVPWQIGTVAQASGVPIKTIRYYEEIGLLKAIGRTEGGFRLFDETVLSRLSFIKRSQQVGLSLLEIKEFLDIHDQGKLPCDQVRCHLNRKLTEIEEQIQQLQILRQQLQGLLTDEKNLSEPSETTICPIIEQI